ncbi:MAG: inorganic diphosphatase [Gammaproteobacteria bacterium]|jgi:inorganic pyrophosphatase|nr:inorganic diphosphatase [Gammaproteobacteria bacterium]
MDIKRISPGRNIPHEINVLIEISQMSGPVKYEFDKETGCLHVDRVLLPSMSYPANYGFIPNTLGDDGDPVDVLVWGPTIIPGAIIAARPIGVLVMSDEKGVDQKILALPLQKSDLMHAHIQDIGDMPEPALRQIKHFFERYKDLESGKWVKVETWENAEVARAIILAGIKKAN